MFFLLIEFNAQVNIYFSIRVKNVNNFKNKWPSLGRKLAERVKLGWKASRLLNTLLVPRCEAARRQHCARRDGGASGSSGFAFHTKCDCGDLTHDGKCVNIADV